jgi:alpha-L-fucosidase 2
VDYRLAPEHPHPAALDDLRAALAFARAHAGELGLDPGRIALLGEDAGCHLALLLAAERPPGLSAVVCLGGIYDTGALARGGVLAERVAAYLGGGPPSRERLAGASPIEQVRPGQPPVMLVHGEKDAAVPLDHARRYAETLARAGVAGLLVEVPGGIHDAENWRPDQWGYKARVIEWLSRKLERREARFEAHDDERLTKNVAYGAFTDRQGAKRELLLDAWVPPGEGPFPGIVLAHGGGWEAGDKVTYLTPLLEPLARAGFAWFSIDYRLTPEHRHPAQLDDLRRAVRFVRHHARRFRIDPARLAAIGESASGQMVAQVVALPCGGAAGAADPVDREPCTVAAAVSLYGVYDFLPMVKDASPRSLLVRLFGHPALDDEGRRLLEAHSPIYHAHRDMPPLLLVHGTGESLWAQGVAFAGRLEQVGARHDLLRLEGAPHGMESWEGRPEWSHWKPAVVDWLRGRLSR